MVTQSLVLSCWCNSLLTCATVARDYDTPARYDTLVPPRSRLRHPARNDALVPRLPAITTPLLATTRLYHRGPPITTPLLATTRLCHRGRRLRHTCSLRHACATAARDYDTPARYDTLVPPRPAITTPLLATTRLCHRGSRLRHPWLLRHTCCWGERPVGRVCAHCRLH